MSETQVKNVPPGDPFWGLVDRHFLGPTELNIRVKVLIRLLGPANVARVSGKSQKQLMRYDAEHPAPSDILPHMLDMEPVSPAWLMGGRVTTREDYQAHLRYLVDRIEFYSVARPDLVAEAQELQKSFSSYWTPERFEAQLYKQRKQYEQQSPSHLVPVLDIRRPGTGDKFDDIPISGQLIIDDKILSYLGRRSTTGLYMITANGDAMAPDISEGSMVLIDHDDTALREGIYAFRLGDFIRIKRLRPYGVAGIEALSSNPAYPPEVITADMRKHFEIFGRAVWNGTRL